MEPKEPSPTHPNRTEHKQEPPTRSRGRPRLPTEQKEQPPKRPRGRPPLTIEQKEERKQLRLANVSQEQKQEQRARHAASHKQGPMPSPLNNTYTSNVVYRNVLL